VFSLKHNYVFSLGIVARDRGEGMSPTSLRTVTKEGDGCSFRVKGIGHRVGFKTH
jgi:hypothetical protein